VEALAKVIGVSESELIRIEANKDFPKIAVLIGLAKFMKINVALKLMTKLLPIVGSVKEVV